ncbi:ABC transporter ATP-binding protein [Siminovitchia sp. FSL W7-1587]|uniref:ABC transporter ATP-binding protein n=1 Tax=Siminovitchia sp. FSL W7-1587 TaxID=2954699 RepID=UPI0030CA7323
MEIMKVEGLTKVIKKKTLIYDISFSIKQGEVFGFLGPNGAGKTTTIRMLTGMIKPTSGNIYINGWNIETDFSKAMRHMGGIVENPSLYLYMSGWENLKQRARLLDSNPTDKDLSDIVELIGLSSRIHEKAVHFSLGMKQRLGIGLALIGRPKMIILDEPINGLDPQGIIDVRNLIQYLSREKNISVFISSHILSELEHVLDRGIIIHEGKKVTDIEKKDLQEADKHTYQIEFQTDLTKEEIEAIFHLHKVQIIHMTNSHIHFSTNTNGAQQILSSFINQKIVITHFLKKEKSLERIYLEAIGSKEKSV